MIDRNHGDRLAATAHLLELCRDFRRCLRFQVVDMGNAAKSLCGVDGVFHLAREGLVEGLVRALEDKAKPVLRQILLQALLDEAGRVIADHIRGFVDTPGGFLAHRQAPVEHPIHRGDTDA
jgi:hypothetical protein